eukprot:TRINITY_DN14560_c0_g1_i1.p1 TRINITY_DN14560_c0_g1~~TRINITY_DN14560_c0_g1_i1.p1  ORF type:complete len:252 (-),score=10.08 TRINITY_DN14560_c0_g1_i1:362-1063(-)
MVLTFVVITSITAYLDYFVAVHALSDVTSRALSAALVTVVRALVVWMTLTSCYLGAHVQAPRTLAVAWIYSFGVSAIVAVAISTYRENRQLSDTRLAIFITFRLIEMFVFSAVMSSSRQKGAFTDEVRARVLRVCTYDELKQYTFSTLQADLNQLTCCVCLDDFRSQDTVAEFHCNHVAHLQCVEKVRQRCKAVYCLMKCECTGPTRRFLIRRLQAVRSGSEHGIGRSLGMQG